MVVLECFQLDMVLELSCTTLELHCSGHYPTLGPQSMFEFLWRALCKPLIPHEMNVTFFSFMN